MPSRTGNRRGNSSICWASRCRRPSAGWPIGADPITAAVITMAGVCGLPLKGVLVRKEAKGHGTQQYVEGPWRRAMISRLSRMS